MSHFDWPHGAYVFVGPNRPCAVVRPNGSCVVVWAKRPDAFVWPRGREAAAARTWLVVEVSWKVAPTREAPLERLPVSW